MLAFSLYSPKKLKSFFKMLTFALYTSKKEMKNFFKVLVFSSCFEKKISKVLAFSLHTTKTSKIFKKGACFLFIYFEATQKIFMCLLFTFFMF